MAWRVYGVGLAALLLAAGLHAPGATAMSAMAVDEPTPPTSVVSESPPAPSTPQELIEPPTPPAAEDPAT